MGEKEKEGGIERKRKKRENIGRRMKVRRRGKRNVKKERKRKGRRREEGKEKKREGMKREFIVTFSGRMFYASFHKCNLIHQRYPIISKLAVCAIHLSIRRR